MRLVVVYWQRSGYSLGVAEYEGDYEIKWRRVTDYDDHGNSEGVAMAVGPDWEALIQYKIAGPNFKFTSINLKPAGDDIPSSLWKRFPLGEIRRYLRKSIADNPSFGSAGAMEHDYGPPAKDEEQRQRRKEQKRRAKKAAEVLRTSKLQRGPGRKNDESWRAITDVYLEEVRTGGALSLHQRMADRINKDLEMDYDAKTMKWMTERARDYGWLTRPGKKGKVGGKKGPRYIEWEKEQE